jgi:large subunit ribosomal protein L5
MNTQKLNHHQKISPTMNNLNNKSKILVQNRENLSKNYYEKILAYDLILKQNYTTIMKLPRIEKIILNTTSKKSINDKKFILFTLAALEMITGQKPHLTYAQKSIANYKIRQHQLIGCKVVLSEKLLFTFLDKLCKIIFPRIREYSKKKIITTISHLQKNQTNRQNLLDFRNKSMKLSSCSLGFHNMMIFPELENHFELVENFRGMNLTFVFSNSNIKKSSLLLSGFQLPV